AAVLKGEVKDVLLLDVTPLSLGIETLGGVSTKLIERNTTIPTRKAQVFSTASDNQPAVTVRVLQGERQMAQDNVELGRFDLADIPPAPRGVPQIEVAFDIDANGIVHVSAKDLGTGKEQSIKITAPHKLSKEEIDKMVKEAERFSSEDAKLKEEVEVRNQADALLYGTEKSLKDYGDKVPADERLNIERQIGILKEALKGRQTQAIQKAIEGLTQVSHKLAEEVYKASANKGGAASAGGPQAEQHRQAQSGPEPQGAPQPDGGKPEDVVDAEYRVDDDKKKS
ncbi:MAG: Hsp70 family protein, partial [Candidatus Omnitrophica bacterium]|nr:Hsp70 family protein [Candidatus Omnitrophota bacterium]